MHPEAHDSIFKFSLIPARIVDIAPAIGSHRVYVGEEGAKEDEIVKYLLFCALRLSQEEIGCDVVTQGRVATRCLIGRILQERLLNGHRGWHYQVIEEELDDHDGEDQEDHLIADRCQHASLLHFKLRADSLGEKIKAVDVVAIREVVDVVPSHRIDTVVKSTHVRSLTCPREVGLQRWSSRIQIAHRVSIVAP